MEGLKIVVLAVILWGFQLRSVQCPCQTKQNVSGNIYSHYPSRDKCWTIPLPPDHFIHLKFKRLEFKSSSCKEGGRVIIDVAGTGELYEFCSTDEIINPITAFGNVTVLQLKKSWDSASSSFELEYSVKTIECINENSFKCDNNSCISEAKVCDGVEDCKNKADEIGCETILCMNANSFKCDDNSCVSEAKVCDGVEDCKNKADEIGCETGVVSIKGVSEAREKSVSWLKQKRTSVWGWGENTPRAIVALYLASAATFNGTVLEEELMAKQTELKTAVALLRSSLTNSELSLFINALLVTCHNPRQFYGNNLVKRLKDQVEESSNFTHPLAYLALCNANESWPLKATSDLRSILNSTSEYPFVKDFQAMALTALSCEANSSRSISNVLNDTTGTLYRNTIQHFMKIQAPDGSFGNVYTTALITQALLSSGQEQNKDWKLNATIQYLMKQLHSSSVDFLATYLTLPILNGKSLMDISYVNCSANLRKHGDDPVSEISDYLGPKMRVQYSLYIGDETDVVHTIFLRVPENYTASEVMELAEVEDPKYKFQRKTTSGKMYVYEIANITNDPEAGKFWLLFVGAANSSQSLIHLTKGPDEIILHDEEHLVFWYKTATI